MKFKRVSAVGFSASLLASCSVGPDFTAPELNLPPEFRGLEQPVAAPAEPAVPQPPAEVVELAQWWKTLNDPILSSLIDRAAEANLDLQIAESRIRQSRAELMIAYGGFFPAFDPFASYSRSQPSGNVRNSNNNSSSTSADSGGTADLAPSSSGSRTTANLFSVGFDSSWEIDVFGGVRREAERAEALYEQQIEARNGALVTLFSEVAQNYILLRGAQRSLDIAERNVRVQEDSLELQRIKLEAGVASDLTVAQVESLVATTRSQIPTLQAQVLQAIHRLSILLNQPPRALEAELAPKQPVPQGPNVVSPGIPSELVRRRPDVRESERALQAATANIGVAVALLFPKFNVTGSLGLKSNSYGDLNSADSTFWSVGALVDIPLFFDRRLLANIDAQDEKQMQALFAYRQTVLQALADVENALVNYNREQERFKLLQRAAESNARALKLARDLYDAGVVDFLNVLTAEQSLFQAEDQLTRSEQSVSTNLVALYKALGGGWEPQHVPAS